MSHETNEANTKAIFIGATTYTILCDRCSEAVKSEAENSHSSDKPRQLIPSRKISSETDYL